MKTAGMTIDELMPKVLETNAFKEYHTEGHIYSVLNDGTDYLTSNIIDELEIDVDEFYELDLCSEFIIQVQQELLPINRLADKVNKLEKQLEYTNRRLMETFYQFSIEGNEALGFANLRNSLEYVSSKELQSFINDRKAESHDVGAIAVMEEYLDLTDKQ